MEYLVVLQAWHLKDQQTPENEEWERHNPLPATRVMRESVLRQGTTRTDT